MVNTLEFIDVPISIFWFRRDLRLDDNHGLFVALTQAAPVLPIFIFDPDILEKLPAKNDKRVAFIFQVLHGLAQQLEQHGSSLFVIHQQPLAAFQHLTSRFQVKAVITNHDYEPYATGRDTRVGDFLVSKGIPFRTCKDQVIFERSEIVKPDGSPYTVFTPYSKTWKRKLQPTDTTVFPSERHLNALFKVAPFSFPSLESIGFEPVDPGVPPIQLQESLIRHYEKIRDIPSIEGTSFSSTYLRFGLKSIRPLVNLALRWNETWLNELIWREFFMMILAQFPQVIHESFSKNYDRIEWRNDEREFDSWCKGETGYPLVDAGMRQLNATGLMHNRVRMVTASFLTKHLLIDWRWGEAYFAEKLLDYELSSNNGNWQWAAGSGCDAAPYFRIFNPTEQQKKFDPDLKYIKSWIKDFRPDYLPPIVDHAFARARALQTYKRALT